MKQYIPYLFLLCSCFIFIENGFSQSYAENTNDKIISAPNAYSIKQITNPNIRLYNGLVKEDIPIWSFDFTDHQFELLLNYTSESINVNRISSWVGMGFSLLSSGSITRTIRGLDDMFYFRNPSQPFAEGDIFANCYVGGDETLGDNAPFILGAMEGKVDSEPDIFQFHAFGLSGKFIFDKNGVPHLLDQKPIEIIPPPTNNLEGTWQIIDEKGTTYIFGGKNTYDYTTNSSSCSSVIDGEFGRTSFPATSHANGNYVTTWHLRSIRTCHGERLDFTYSPYSVNIQNPRQITEYKGSRSSCPSKKVTCNSQQFIDGYYLSSISSHNGYRLDFIKSGRCDLPGDQKLDQVNISLDNKTIKQILFDFSYAPDDLNAKTIAGCGDAEIAKSYRLWLHKVSFLSSKTAEVDFYKFSYNAGSFLPRGNWGDKWGYNGEPDVGLLNRIDYPTGGFKTFAYEPNEYSNFPGVGQEIETCNSSQGVSTHSLCRREHVMNCDGSVLQLSSFGAPATIRIQSFTYSSYHPSHPIYLSIGVSPTGNDGTRGFTIKLNAPTPPPNGQPPRFNSVDLPAGQYSITLFVDPIYDVYEPGHRTDVTFVLNKEPICVTKVEHRQQGGGYRISQIEIHDADGASRRFNYTYDDLASPLRSSGKLMSAPVKKYSYTFTKPTLIGSNSGGLPIWFAEDCKYDISSQSSSLGIGYSAQGSAVGYSAVKVMEVSPNSPGVNNGYELFEFENHAEIFDIDHLALGTPFISYSHINGRLLKKQVYDSNEKLMLEVAYKYRSEVDHRFSQDGYRFSGIYGFSSFPCKNITTSRYRIVSNWTYLKEKIVETFPGSSSISNKITTYYFYDNPVHKQLTREERRRTGESSPFHEVFNKYPDDFSVRSNSNDAFEKAIYLLKNYNIKHEKLEQTIISNGSPNSKATKSVLKVFHTTDYNTYPYKRPEVAYHKALYNDASFTPLKLTANGMSYDGDYFVQSSNEYLQFIDGPTRKKNTQDVSGRFELYTYDELHRISSVTTSNTKKDTYMNSFESNGTLGQAKSGVRYHPSSSYTIPREFDDLIGLKMSYWYYHTGEWTFSGVVDFSPVINAPGTRIDEIRVFPVGSFMTTYTYNDLGQVNSQTDENGITTYYEYDNSDRLQMIKDNNRNILKRYEYRLLELQE